VPDLSAAATLHRTAGPVDRPMPRALMLVSERADVPLREAVREGRRPCPEYLRLEERHRVDLLDWSRLRGGGDRRGVRLSLRHAGAAARLLRQYEVVLSDGEHVGIPLALALRARRLGTPHVMVAHHLTTAAKRLVFRAVRARDGVDRILVHSSRQAELVATELGVPPHMVRTVPYFADTEFWRPGPASESPLIVAAGQEHRDYVTLARACARMPTPVRIAAGSYHSPSARQARPTSWPPNVSVGFADRAALRDLYARATVVVVPLLETEFQAGVTTLLEAMAMGRAVVVTATAGQRDVAVDGETAVTVPPGDVPAMRGAITRLLADPQERIRLGAAARRAVEDGFSLQGYADALAGHLREVAATAGRRPPAGA
jgi:glycosyltransferase involved in cell wall biosynthesis